MIPPHATDLSEDTRNFFNGLKPRRRDPPWKGEPLVSLICGGMAIVLGGINLAAFLGYSARSLPNLVRRATIVLDDSSNRVVLGWWYVPDEGFWTLVAPGLLLATIGLYPTRRGGRPITSAIGFVVNVLAFVAGMILGFTDYRVW
ncbi:hypothetical protein P12x_000602 [Tundrisphaera lichenicola]|uniref:hypothetical protein n=1 Tax=Tundrisphaera lichenicola TaxID=2029860 RepID=UPI003EB7F748